MTVTLVDSNVLLDVATEDSVWSEWSADALAAAADQGALVINPIVYAEVSVGFATIEELDDVLRPETFHRADLPYQAGFLAAKAFAAYRRRGGSRVVPLPDFFVGAHAAVSRFRLLSRDPRRYRSYFPTVELLSP
ncbi:MAG: type II toxin-antitoxin system VapC family toxin [Actinomycetes bacterium]